MCLSAARYQAADQMNRPGERMVSIGQKLLDDQLGWVVLDEAGCCGTVNVIVWGHSWLGFWRLMNNQNWPLFQDAPSSKE